MRGAAKFVCDVAATQKFWGEAVPRGSLDPSQRERGARSGPGGGTLVASATREGGRFEARRCDRRWYRRLRFRSGFRSTSKLAMTGRRATTLLALLLLPALLASALGGPWPAAGTQLPVPFTETAATEGCHCWAQGTECRCFGDSVHQVPARLADQVEKL
ncbi:hypothetical protein HPB49_025030 [Dermacentor silvarum]|uniref:Uncharacterized protein n=1 Tax=Dermacentor silvarum TaxID=543639 RepID=A0ACB8DLL2_DERSI|nr:hypothetical protein HPB49_025030 [Dermacentor silvarum]